MMCWKNKPKLNILTVNSGNHLIDHYVPALLWNSSNGSQSGPLDLLSNRYSCLISQEWNATLSFIILAHTEANSSYSLPVKRTRWKWWKFCRHGTKRSSVVSLSNSANGVLETLIDFLQWFFVHQSIRIDRWTTWDNYGLWDPGHSNLILEKQPISESSGEIYHGSTVIWGYCIKKKKLMCSIIFKSYQSFTRPNPTTRLPFFRIEIHEPVKPGSDQMTDCKRLVAKRTPWAALRSRWFLERTTHWKTWRGHGSVNKWERMNERTDEWTFFSQLLPLQATSAVSQVFPV